MGGKKFQSDHFFTRHRALFPLKIMNFWKNSANSKHWPTMIFLCLKYSWRHELLIRKQWYSIKYTKKCQEGSENGWKSVFLRLIAKKGKKLLTSSFFGRFWCFLTLLNTFWYILWNTIIIFSKVHALRIFKRKKWWWANVYYSRNSFKIHNFRRKKVLCGSLEMIEPIIFPPIPNFFKDN